MRLWNQKNPAPRLGQYPQQDRGAFSTASVRCILGVRKPTRVVRHNQWNGSTLSGPRDAGFERHPERPKEWCTRQWVKPLTHFKVKHQELGDFYLRNKRLQYHSRPYTGEEVERFRDIAAAHGRVPELDSSEFHDLRETIPPQVIRLVLEDQTTAYSQI